jgi:hypothetical protein
MTMNVNRRRFLRAASGTLLLPWLDVFAAPGGPKPRQRMVCLCAPLGLHPANLFPEKAGNGGPVTWNGPISVCLYADELGGPFDGKVGCTEVKFERKPGEPPDSQTRDWVITYPPTASGPLPDPSADSQLYRLAAVFVYGEQSWDIAAFVELGTYLIN